jgi:hypothetical protein
MTNQHPITPPLELVHQWTSFACEEEDGESWNSIATQAAQWGADQELEACYQHVDWVIGGLEAKELRAARRPKLPNLNSIALQMLGTIERDAHYIPEITDTIRRALEALDD